MSNCPESFANGSFYAPRVALFARSRASLVSTFDVERSRARRELARARCGVTRDHLCSNAAPVGREWRPRMIATLKRRSEDRSDPMLVVSRLLRLTWMCFLLLVCTPRMRTASNCLEAGVLSLPARRYVREWNAFLVSMPNAEQSQARRRNVQRPS